MTVTFDVPCCPQLWSEAPFTLRAWCGGGSGAPVLCAPIFLSIVQLLSCLPAVHGAMTISELRAPS